MRLVSIALAPSRARPRALPSQRGLTLVELMVGLTLGLLITVALLRLFADVSTSGQNLQRTSAEVENGRYAGELLRDDLQMAGYYGEAPFAGAAATNPDPCAIAATDFTASPLAFPAAVRGYGATEALSCVASRRSGTDALAVRRVDTNAVSVDALGASNAQWYLQTSYCETDATATPLVFEKSPVAFTLRNRACTAMNPLRAFVSRVYFVADCNRCDRSGDGVPTLKRVDLLGSNKVETALVEGVEVLRFEYGFDTNGDGTADTFRTTADSAGAASNWGNVVSLKLHYVVRSNEKASGVGLSGTQTFTLGNAGVYTVVDDGYLRRAYSTTVRLINVSSVREAQ